MEFGLSSPAQTLRPGGSDHPAACTSTSLPSRRKPARSACFAPKHPASQQTPQVVLQPAVNYPGSTRAAPPRISPQIQQALGIDPLLQQLHDLEESGRQASLQALTLRQQLLERVLSASFAVDSALARIDTEASYAEEDRYVLQQKNQRQANTLNLLTFAASGALGAAGSAMQLTHGLNHAGTALQAAAGGTSLILSGVQLKAGGGKLPIRSPYNMLAEILDRAPNDESHYPPLVLAYLHAPRPDGRPPIADGITAAWRRLGRVKQGPKDNGAPIDDLVADRTSNTRLTSDELADREAMLRDLHANIIGLRAELQQVLQQVESSHTP